MSPIHRNPWHCNPEIGEAIFNETWRSVFQIAPSGTVGMLCGTILVKNIYFIETKTTKVKSECYQKLLNEVLLADRRTMYQNEDYVFQQDGATSLKNRNFDMSTFRWATLYMHILYISGGAKKKR